MTGASWACTAVLCWQLNATGALPREVRVDDVRAYAAGHRAVRVLVFNGARQLTLRPKVAADIEDYTSRKRLAVVSAGARITVTPSRSGIALRGSGLRLAAPRVAIRPRSPHGGIVVSSQAGWGRRAVYSGALDIAPAAGRLRVVEHVDLETYIAGVVAAEMPSSFPLEAAKAQAVAARTYALQHLGGHARDDADLCARVHCQAYAGTPPADSTAARAARQTAGQVLSWNGLLVSAFYHSACGGATAPAWEVRQGTLLPYLRGVPDAPPNSRLDQPYCGADHNLNWTRRFSREQAQRLVSSNLSRVLGHPNLSPGKLDSLRMVRSRGSTRAAWLDVITDSGVYRVRGDGIRWLFGHGYAGPGGLRSTAFHLDLEADSSGALRAVTFHGVGYGHGIGLCQWGARGRALAGQSAEDILTAYYPGAVVTDLRR